MALVFEVIRSLHRSTDGINPLFEKVSKATALIPSRLSAILKYDYQNRNLQVHMKKKKLLLTDD